MDKLKMLEVYIQHLEEENRKLRESLAGAMAEDAPPLKQKEYSVGMRTFDR